MKLFDRLCFSLFLLASPLPSHAGNEAVLRARVMAAVRSGSMQPQAALQLGRQHRIDLSVDLAPYLFPPHWQQFFTHFNGLAYDQLAQQLDDLARHHHAGAFIAASLQDIPNVPARNPGTPLSQWLTTVRNALFDNGGRLQHNQDRKPQFEKFILAAQVQESISHAEDVAFCARVFNKAVNGNQTIQAAYADELGNIPCPGINGMNIAGDVAQRVINNRLPRNQASIEAQIHAHTQHLTQGNFGLDEEFCQRVAETITTGSSTYLAALTQHLKPYIIEQMDIKADIAQKILNENKPFIIAAEEASVARRKNFLKGLDLGLADDICERVAIDVSNGDTYLKALQNRLPREDYEGENLTPYIAKILWEERVPLPQATQQASKLARAQANKNSEPSEDECKYPPTPWGER